MLALLGCGGLLVTVLATLASGPAPVAAFRTGVITVSALGLALAGREPRLLELAWLVYPLLATAAMKLLFEDLRVGKAATLFPAFVLFGVALIVTPRLMRRVRTVEPAPAEGRAEVRTAAS